MTFREFLHVEVWSKKTSRVIALVALVFCFGLLIWAGWTTPRVKFFARMAMKRADSISNPESLSQADFDKRYAEAVRASADAQNAGITLQDRTTSLLVKGYVAEIQQRRILWLLPDEKMATDANENDRRANGRQKKLLLIAQVTEGHERFKEKLEGIVGKSK